MASDVVGGNGNSQFSAMSGDGRFVAIASNSSDLSATISDANGFTDVYLRDLVTGTTSLVSRRFGRPSQTAGGGNSGWVNQTPDGRFVVFTDSAANVVTGQIDTGRSVTGDKGTLDVFLHDRAAGTTVLVSHAAGAPTTAANADSTLAVISADGRYVAYCSYATDLVPGFVDSNGPLSANYYSNTDIFLYDRLTGVNELVSRKAGTVNVGGNYTSGTFFTILGAYLSISSDGRWVSFRSLANDLVAGMVDNNGTIVENGIGSDVYLYDRVSGTNRLVSHLPGQPLATVNSTSFASSMSGDGRFVAYWTNSSNMVPGMVGGGRNVILYNRDTDTNVLVSHSAASLVTGGNGGSNDPSISRDGSVVVFQSAATNLVAGQSDTNADNDIFVYDCITGSVTLVSHAAGTANSAGNLASSFWAGSLDNSGGRYVSADGRFIVYASLAQNLVAGFSAGTSNPDDENVLLYDRVTGSNVLVSHAVSASTAGGNGDSRLPTISGDGRFVAYQASATDVVSGLVLPSTGNTYNVMLYDRLNGKSRLASFDVSNFNVGSNDSHRSLTINHNGTVIAYTSEATNLVTDDLNRYTDVFAYVTLPPTITSIKVADGSAQRSVVRTLTVTFDQPVMFAGDPAGAFVVRRGSETVALSAAVTTGTATTVTLTFSGPGTQFGSLVDGRYSLTVLSNQVLGIEALDGDADGLAGGDYVANFHRLFGDSNGDARVDSVDFLAFRLGLGLNNPAFDFDGDGIVGPSDFLQFRLRFLQAI
ncbi:MAG: hypothetical protein K1X57_07870 [Gemmataceae bacterium]|nr:hypothetical protein [Gemmataceae bacterium]